MVAEQNYPDGITKNQKDALRNKAKKFAIRDGLLYHCVYSSPGNSARMSWKLYEEEIN